MDLKTSVPSKKTPVANEQEKVLSSCQPQEDLIDWTGACPGGEKKENQRYD
ncbi:unnamed protein product [Sphenostylis stenocarpa]|uniref:Uncharacterized protein n=1 Tax=Sphenostylis stenocarpa TaxID=92480 RepID=A0AA86VLT3_9FABA|nr:unnamed protein product [Sphenostylis stenocarpa]